VVKSITEIKGEAIAIQADVSKDLDITRLFEGKKNFRILGYYGQQGRGNSNMNLLN